MAIAPKSPIIHIPTHTRTQRTNIAEFNYYYIVWACGCDWWCPPTNQSKKKKQANRSIFYLTIIAGSISVQYQFWCNVKNHFFYLRIRNWESIFPIWWQWVQKGDESHTHITHHTSQQIQSKNDWNNPIWPMNAWWMPKTLKHVFTHTTIGYDGLQINNGMVLYIYIYMCDIWCRVESPKRECNGSEHQRVYHPFSKHQSHANIIERNSIMQSVEPWNRCASGTHKHQAWPRLRPREQQQRKNIYIYFLWRRNNEMRITATLPKAIRESDSSWGILAMKHVAWWRPMGTWRESRAYHTHTELNIEQESQGIKIGISMSKKHFERKRSLLFKFVLMCVWPAPNSTNAGYLSMSSSSSMRWGMEKVHITGIITINTLGTNTGAIP